MTPPVWILDDDAALATEAAAAFEAAGVPRAVPFSDPQAVLRELKAAPTASLPAVLVADLDLGSGRMNGVTLIVKAREVVEPRTGGMWTILVSRHPEDDLRPARGTAHRHWREKKEGWISTLARDVARLYAPVLSGDRRDGIPDDLAPDPARPAVDRVFLFSSAEARHGWVAEADDPRLRLMKDCPLVFFDERPADAEEDTPIVMFRGRDHPVRFPQAHHLGHALARWRLVARERRRSFPVCELLDLRAGRIASQTLPVTSLFNPVNALLHTIETATGRLGVGERTGFLPRWRKGASSPGSLDATTWGGATWVPCPTDVVEDADGGFLTRLHVILPDGEALQRHRDWRTGRSDEANQRRFLEILEGGPDGH